MTKFTRRAALALPLAAPAITSARAADWRPTQQVRIICPAAAGGTADMMARLLGQHLTSAWGQTAVVENRGGAGGIIGTQEFLRAPADGHTILSGNIGPQGIGYSLYRNYPFRPDMVIPVAGSVRGPNVLVVNPSIPANNVAELVAHLKANPGKLSYGSPGIGQSGHLTSVWFSQLTGTQGIHVPFRGAGPAAIELVAGNIQYMFDNLSSGIEQIRGGRVRALAVTSAERNPQLPDVPALRETMPQLGEFEVNTWFGKFYKAGTPPAAVQALNEQMRILAESDGFKARVAQIGSVSLWGTPDQFATFVNNEIAKWRGVIQREGLQMDVS
ncbi:tripartite tricarboxylate transporter substrate binding protein [Roseococcus sp. SYP-B2431]|uniref:Bug family tripartite tricarboxylate transporter substrate binding protein n=1 Tax=Roseococcus sp. SYP-B2431 TaxID=2496640 RepID=UPI00103D4A6E|nr:tripartite tricarboxylate transporter substrate binding protein [Roseococcus sp. SYP-B2431]TCH96200.1 tripartite tricarboxylate transporter substrate binding protein [Roseococcus sp. SYP-B2431]